MSMSYIEATIVSHTTNTTATAHAEYISLHDDPEEFIQLEWTSGERVELLPWRRRALSGLFSTKTFYAVRPPRTLSVRTMMICRTSSRCSLYARRDRRLCQVRTRARLTERYDMYIGEEGPTYTDHEWVKVTID